MKQQHILFFSDQHWPAAELPVRQGERYRLTHCAGDGQDIDQLERMQRRYDWILFDGALVEGDQRELVRSLRAMGLLFPGDGGDACGHRSCRVEWDANGTLQLHCGGHMRSSGCPPDRRAGPGGEAGDSFIFEYHAPMKRTG